LRKHELIAIDRRLELVSFPNAEKEGGKDILGKAGRKREYVLFLRKKREGVFTFVSGAWDAKLSVRELRTAD
jgi:hypothetical protein